MDKSKLGTAVLMIGSLLLVPILTYFFGVELSPIQKTALNRCIVIYLTISTLCFLVSEITRNCSQVDKIWSIVPIIYAWVICYYSGFETRVLVMALLVSVWGIRLTYNFSRRGAYTLKFWAGEEDYRWAVLREDPAFNTRTKWFFFNLGFISFYQNALIFLFVSPMILTIGSPHAFGLMDALVVCLIIGFIIFETIADQQQWNFHLQKNKLKKENAILSDVYAKGFVAEGLWRMCRHPNYFGEQSIWVSFYFFSVIATGQWFNWSVLGCILLLVLFQGSSDFSEGISLKKYSLYQGYKNKTNRFFPVFWKK